MIDFIELEGMIVKGRGIATKALDSDIKLLNIYFNTKIIPGSINIILTKPVNIQSKYSINRIGIVNTLRRRWFWESEVDGQLVFLTRWQLCPFHIIEGVSEFNFRENLYENGDLVKIKVPREWVKPLSRVQNILWLILWYGRKKLWYSSYIYWRVVRMVRVKNISGSY